VRSWDDESCEPHGEEAGPSSTVITRSKASLVAWTLPGDALGPPSEVMTMVGGYILLRASFVGFLTYLLTGDKDRAIEQANLMTFASFPGAVLFGVACTLYLILR
jgi:hypothetical protein